MPPYAVMTITSPEHFVVWREGTWCCEIHRGPAGAARLEIYNGDNLVNAESIPTGPTAMLRAEVLRQRVLRGDLRAES